MEKTEKVASWLKGKNIYAVVGVVVAIVLAICLLIAQNEVKSTKIDNLSSRFLFKRTLPTLRRI